MAEPLLVRTALLSSELPCVCKTHISASLAFALHCIVSLHCSGDNALNVLQHCSSGHLCLDHLCNAEQPTSPYSPGQTAQPNQGSGLPGDPQTGSLSHPATGTDAHASGQSSRCQSGQMSRQADEARTQQAVDDSSHSGIATATANDILLMQDAYSISCFSFQQVDCKRFQFGCNAHQVVCVQCAASCVRSMHTTLNAF